MIIAEEARKISVQNESVAKELLALEDKIMKEASRGLVRMIAKMSSAAASELRELGYSVTKHSEDYTISWDNA